MYGACAWRAHPQVRLHTMLPGNTVVRRAKADVTYADTTVGNVRIPQGTMIWLYPNAVRTRAHRTDSLIAY